MKSIDPCVFFPILVANYKQPFLQIYATEEAFVCQEQWPETMGVIVVRKNRTMDASREPQDKMDYDSFAERAVSNGRVNGS